MTLCEETAYKWASLSKRIAAWCLNRNSTVSGVIITVTFCIIGVCALWIWGRMMTTLINQWPNEAAIVLVYWNTVTWIEDFCIVSMLNVLLSYYVIAHGKKTVIDTNDSCTLHTDKYTTCACQYDVHGVKWRRGRSERKRKLDFYHVRFFNYSHRDQTAMSGLRAVRGSN